MSEDARVVGSLNRRRRGPDKRLAELDRNVAAGDRSVSFPRREFRSGRYYVLITASDGFENRSPRVKAPFRIA